MTIKMTQADLEASFDDILDNTNPEVTILGITFSPSYILRELDPIAYECSCNDYASNMDIETVDEDEYDDSMDGDAGSALASAGYGTDEDYNCSFDLEY